MRRREIIGTSVSVTDYEEVVGTINGAIANDSRIYICCAPASTLVFARNDAALASALESADIVTPDGMGVVHAARLLGESIDGRVYGPDLMALALASSPARHFLYGGFDEAALAQLREALAERFPGAEIVGVHSPPHRELSDDELGDVIGEINRSGAEVVWVGIGSPKQEVWMQRVRAQLDAPVMIGVGAAFDFFAGRVSQAPSWMQNASLEWLYRAIKEPARLGTRYLKTLPHFVLLVIGQRLRESVN